MSSPTSSNSPVASNDHSPLLDKEEAQEEPEHAGRSEDAPRSTPRSSAEPTPVTSTSAATPSSANWQAIWSPMHNAYYFYNAITHETTWVNPLQPTAAASSAASTGETTTATPDPSAPTSSTSASASTSASSAPAPSAADSNPQEEDPSSAPSSTGATPVPASIAQIYALQEAAAAQGIDPSLAHLDPSLAGPSSAPGGAYNFSARFNAHTGTFTRPDGRDPTHLSEYERMKRMSSVYFNMEQWEQEVAQRQQREDEDAANGKKRKRPTKKDLVSCLFPPGFALAALPERSLYSFFRTASKSRRGSKRSQRQLGCAPRSWRVSNSYSRGQFFFHDGHSVIPVSSQSSSKAPRC